MNRDYKEPTIQLNKVESKEKADKFNAAHYSTGAVAASFTSTTMGVRLEHEPAIIHEDEVRYERVKKKGMSIFYVVIVFLRFVDSIMLKFIQNIYNFKAFFLYNRHLAKVLSVCFFDYVNVHLQGHL